VILYPHNVHQKLRQLESLVPSASARRRQSGESRKRSG
jgi:hypothetical protein